MPTRLWLFLLGMCLGAAYACWGLSPNSGSRPRLHPTLWPVMHEGRLMIPVGRRALHVHHWIVCGALLPFLGAYPVLQGAALVLLVQGLTYKDRFSVLEENPWLRQAHIGASTRAGRCGTHACSCPRVVGGGRRG